MLESENFISWKLYDHLFGSVGSAVLILSDGFLSEIIFLSIITIVFLIGVILLIEYERKLNSPKKFYWGVFLFSSCWLIFSFSNWWFWTTDGIGGYILATITTLSDFLFIPLLFGSLFPGIMGIPSTMFGLGLKKT